MEKICKFLLGLSGSSFSDITGDTQSRTMNLISKSEAMLLGKVVRCMIDGKSQFHSFSPGIQFLVRLLHPITPNP